MTLVRAPISYMVSFYMPRSRHEQVEEVRGEATVEIVDLADEDAPVALEISGKQKITKYRWRDGHFYRRLATPGYGNGLVLYANDYDRLLDKAHEQGQPWTDSPFLRREAGHPVSTAKMRTINELGARQISDDGRRDAELKAAQAAGDMAIIRGEFWIRTPEPVFRINFSRDKHIQREPLAIVTKEPTADPGFAWLSIDQAKLARELVEKLHPGWLEDDRKRLGVTVRNKAALAFDPVMINAINLKMAVAPAFAKEIGALASTESIRRWADFMDVIDALDTTDRSTAFAAAGALDDFLQHDLATRAPRERQPAPYPAIANLEFVANSYPLTLAAELWKGLSRDLTFSDVEADQMDRDDAVALAM